MLELAPKPDAEEALERMERWWRCENEERAILTLSIDSNVETELPRYASHRDAWMDFDGRVERALKTVGNKRYIAETFPVFEPNLGPDILSTIFGLSLEFEPSTSWGRPIVETIDQFLQISPDFEAPLWQAVERLQRMAIEAGRGKWITLYTDLHPNMDVPAALMGQENLCYAIADEPEKVAQACRWVTSTCIEAYRRQIAPIQAEGLPYGGWILAFSQEPTYIPECDFSALIGTSFFNNSVVDSIRVEMAAARRNIYHLDGLNALRYLDTLLDIPEIDAVQWVFGAGHGPARNWVDVYRKILASGKAIRVEAEDIDDIRALRSELGAKGVWFNANFSAPDWESAEQVLRLL